MLRLDIEPQVAASPSKSTMPEPSSAKPIYIEHPILTLERLEWQDERSKLHLWVALWASISVHLILVILGFIYWPRIVAWEEARQAAQVRETAPQEALKDKELTYLQLPPAPVVQPKDSSIISDQNRSATVKQPQLDRKRLKEILDSTQAKPGAPGMNMPALPKSAPEQPREAQQQPPEQGQPHQPENQLAHLESPPIPPRPARGAFNSNLSAGSAIEEAARESAKTGSGGDYGPPPMNPRGNVQSDMEVLSDTMGVDFSAYLARLVHDVRLNWYNLVPEVARPPLRKTGKVTIDFVITKNGGISGMKIMSPSGDISLDRAAYGGITAVNPFQPLPTNFRGQYLALRFRFLYNPDRMAELR
ncbi:MAG: TonB family protein [Terriglobales bacterium]|jgi:TonB family protein